MKSVAVVALLGVLVVLAAGADARRPDEAPRGPVPAAAPVVEGAAVEGAAVARRPARATTTTTLPDQVTAEELTFSRALAALDFPWRRTGFAVVLGEARDGLLGITRPQERRIEIYVRPGQSVEEVARTVAHEVGHAVDIAFMSPWERVRYRDARGLGHDRMWAPCPGCSDYQSPAGDFAETFAWAVLGPGDFRSQMAPPPGPHELELLEQFFFQGR